MVANLNDAAALESFLRDADAPALLAERAHLQDLLRNATAAEPAPLLTQLAARIAYELRFRISQPV